MKIFGFGGKKRYKASDILMQLDQCAAQCTFPMLDNGYVYLADSRLSAYRDNKRWVIVIEVVGFNYRAGGHDGIDNCLYIFGNCLDFEPGTNNNNFLFVTDDSEDGKTFDEEYQDSLNPEVTTMLLRNKKINVPHEPEFYLSRGVELSESPKIMIWEFLRGIMPDFREEFLATEQEIRERIPHDLPILLRLDQWHHNDLADRENPGEIETFNMIAKCLETGNVKHYKPVKAPNNHWKNWPDGGTL